MIRLRFDSAQRTSAPRAQIKGRPVPWAKSEGTHSIHQQIQDTPGTPKKGTPFGTGRPLHMQCRGDRI